MAEANLVNFSENINRAWYNAFQGAPASIFSPGQRARNHQASSPTLHAYQSFGDKEKCGVLIRINDQWVGIPFTPATELHFTIGGGAEIPYFCLTLRVKSPNAVDTSEIIVLKAIWTAWGEKGFQTDRPVNNPAQNPSTNESYTFSSRLGGVRIRHANLTSQNIKLCGGTEGSRAFYVEWTHYHPPYCYGFQISDRVMGSLGFSDTQRMAVQNFLALARPEGAVRVITQSQGHLFNFWRFMTAMPVPTPGPYPLYDCRYWIEQETFARIAEVPSLNHKDIEEHHCRHERGWVNRPPAFIIPKEMLSMHATAPTTFINEREYEVIKTVGLLREAYHQKDLMHSEFNRTYSFLLIPGSTLHGVYDGSFDDIFYTLLDAATQSVTHHSDSISEQALVYPEPGTPVRVIKRIASRVGSSAIASSSLSATQDKEEWVGVVIAAQQWPAKDMDPIGESKICIRLRRPNNTTGGLVLNMTGFVFFGSLNPPYAQARSAIRYALYGNPQFEIPRHNHVRKLLLGHDNHIMKYLQSSSSVAPQTESHLAQLQNVLNDKQLTALRSSFSTGSSWDRFMSLIIGPPGTGKTWVSAHVVAHCRRLEEPVLVVCGSNYGLDAAAERIAKLFGSCRPSISLNGVYRLGTEYGESHEMQISSENRAGRFESKACSHPKLSGIW